VRPNQLPPDRVPVHMKTIKGGKNKFL
jgi:hypothetical protein